MPSARRRPRTASTKHSVQASTKPIVVISAALAMTAPATQAADTQSARGAPEGGSIWRKPPVRDSHTSQAPHTISTTATNHGSALGPTPP